MKGNSTQLRRRARLIKKTVPDVKLLGNKTIAVVETSPIIAY